MNMVDDNYGWYGRCDNCEYDRCDVIIVTDMVDMIIMTMVQGLSFIEHICIISYEFIHQD